VKAGDVWTVGKHRLICGDATKREDVQKLMDGKKANLILTDPPYAVSYESASGLSIKNDNLKADEFYDFLLSSFKNMIDVSEAGASAYVFHADTEGLTFRKAFEDAGFHLSGVCIWAKRLAGSRKVTLPSGRMSRFSLAGIKKESTSGMRAVRKRQSGSLPSLRKTRTIRPQSRLTF